MMNISQNYWAKNHELIEGGIFRHVKRGSEYHVLVVFHTEAYKSSPLNDNDLVPVFSYANDDGEQGYAVTIYGNYAHCESLTSTKFAYVTKSGRKVIDEWEDYENAIFHGDAKIQTEKPLTGDIELVIYQDVKTLDFYARPFLEFMDGRFIKVENERLAQ